MPIDIYLGAYWGARQESARACASRLARCLAGFGTISPLLAAWYQERRDILPSVEEMLDLPEAEIDALYAAHEATAPGIPVPVSVDHLSSLLEPDRYRGALDDTIIENMGYIIDLWTGDPHQGIVCSGACGGWAPVGTNSFVLNFLDENDEMRSLIEPPTAKSLLRVAVEAWDADWAIVTRARVSNLKGRPNTGWITFLGPRYQPVPDLGDTAVIEPNFAGGTLVQVAETLDEATPDAVSAVHERLHR